MVGSKLQQVTEVKKTLWYEHWMIDTLNQAFSNVHQTPPIFYILYIKGLSASQCPSTSRSHNIAHTRSIEGTPSDKVKLVARQAVPRASDVTAKGYYIGINLR